VGFPPVVGQQGEIGRVVRKLCKGRNLPMSSDISSALAHSLRPMGRLCIVRNSSLLHAQATREQVSESADNGARGTKELQYTPQAEIFRPCAEANPVRICLG